jgi:WD40 repeat protein
LASKLAVDASKDEISCLVYSNHFGVIASGSVKGILQIYDIEMFKLVAVSKQSDQSIKSIHFCNEWPLIIICRADG